METFDVRRRRWPFALMALGAIGLALSGAAYGAARATSDAAAEAGRLAASGQYGASIALQNQIATRTGLLFVMNRSDVTAAPHRSQATLLTWAAALAHSGKPDQAAVLLANVTDPSLMGSAASERATLFLTAAKQDAARGDFGAALLRLNQITALQPSASIAGEVAQLTPQYQVGAAKALTAKGNGVDAVALLDLAAAAAPSQAAAVAQALPAALLAAAKQEITLLSYKEAAATLQRLRDNFPNTGEARTARQLLRQGQPVTGTLVDKSGHPLKGQVRLSSHYFTVPGGYYTTGPFYYSSSNADGGFDFSSIPIGGPYTFEVFRGGNWMTFVDPTTNQPANPVNVTPLTPVDMTYVALPA
jgi:hypothetical protein